MHRGIPNSRGPVRYIRYNDIIVTKNKQFIIIPVNEVHEREEIHSFFFLFSESKWIKVTENKIHESEQIFFFPEKTG